MKIILLGLLLVHSAFAGTAADFALTDLNGKQHKLSDYLGKIVVLEWTNYDCPYVRKHYKSGNMQKLQKEWTKKGVVWLSINSSAKGKEGNFSNSEWKKRISENGSSPTAVLLDESGEVGKAYGAKTTPHMFVVDGRGELQYSGAIDSISSTNTDDISKSENYVNQALNQILKKQVVKIKQTAPYGCSVKY